MGGGEIQWWPISFDCTCMHAREMRRRGLQQVTLPEPRSCDLHLGRNLGSPRRSQKWLCVYVSVLCDPDRRHCCHNL